METRKRIVIGAIELFLRSGIKSVTMNDIAAHLGMSKRTIYENFADKDALVSDCLMYLFTMRDDFYSDLVKNANSVIDIFIEFVECGARFHDDRILLMVGEIKKLYPAIFEEIVVHNTAKNRVALINILERGIREGNIIDTINVELTADLFQGQMMIVHNYDALKSGRYAFLEIFQTLLKTFFRGVSTEQGVREIDKRMVWGFRVAEH